MSGGLSEVERHCVVQHLDTCEECRELLAVVAGATTQSGNVVALPGDLAFGATLSSNTAEPSDGVERPPSLVPGSSLGRYTLEAQIGEGAMGRVWRARDPKLGRLVALKLLRQRNDLSTKQLISEAQVMAQLSHPNVVSVYDVGVAEGVTYIAMELVVGRSLRLWMSGGQRSVPEILATFIAAGRGLAAAHAAGIVHRDFKPDNVLVGDDGRVRVSDFGLAARPVDRDVELDPNSLDVLAPGALLGTPAYMAPEQFSGANVDTRTDQFSFCAALYEALYGQRPFSGRTFFELADNVVKGNVKPPPAHRQVSSGLRSIVMRGVLPRPGDRFPSLDHVLAELARDRARPWRRVAIACAALAGVLALGLGADAAVRARVDIQIRQSFALTGKHLDHTAKRLNQHFHEVSAIAYREPALRHVAGHRDQADFFLGTPAADREELERLHQMLAATDWAKVGDSQRAVIDYKGRLLYTSFAPQVWNTDARVLPPIKRALDAGRGDSVTVLSATDPALVATQVLGPRPNPGLVVVFVRVLALGDTANNRSEARAIYLELEDARHLLEELRLDDRTLLGVVGNDGTIVGDAELPTALVRAAPPEGQIATLSHSGRSFQVQSRSLRGLDGTGQVARVVMARPLESVLQLFPGARLGFTLAAMAALIAATVTGRRARQLSGPRIA